MQKILLILVLGFHLLAQAATVNTLEKGNLIYQKADFKGAIKEYERLVQQGLSSPELFYNLGNAYYKTNDIPSAVLNYEKAKKLDPTDEDIDFNLRMANLKVVDKVSPIPEIFYRRWYKSLLESFTSNSWSIACIVFMWIGLLLAAFFIISQTPGLKRLFFYLGFILILTGISCYFFAGAAHKQEITSDSAILFEPSIYVKGSPDEKSTDLFILHEGAKVTVIDELNNWKRIRIANGNEGWIPSSAAKPI